MKFSALVLLCCLCGCVRFPGVDNHETIPVQRPTQRAIIHRDVQPMGYATNDLVFDYPTNFPPCPCVLETSTDGVTWTSFSNWPGSDTTNDFVTIFNQNEPLRLFRVRSVE